MQKDADHKRDDAPKGSIPVEEIVKAKADSNPPKQNPDNASQEKKPMTTYEKASLVVTCGGVFVAIFVLIVYFFQLEAMWQSVKDGQRALQLDQRAWVGPIESRIGDFAAGSYFRTTVRIRNSGGSPAIEVENSFFLQNVPKGQMPNFSNLWERSAKGPRSKSVLQPDGIIVVSPSTEAEAPLNMETINAIVSGEYISYIFGEIRYADIFGDHHWTKWCYFYQPTRDIFSLCSFHNDVDLD